MLGSFIPSSPSLVRRLSEQIPWSSTQVLVEYGPGVGTVTTALLRHMRPDGMLVAIDFNRDFATHLGQAITDPRLRVVHASAAEVDRVLASLGLAGADCVVSGIPHSTLPADVRARIIEKTREVLRPGGSFIVYQFTGAVLPQLEQAFGDVRQQRELRNILPARIFCCSR